MQTTSGHVNVEILALGEFHGNVYRAGHDRKVVIHRQPANHLRRCSSGSKSDDVALLDQLRRSPANSPFLFGESSHLRLEGAVIPKRLVEERLDGDGTTMSAAQ